jgi:hypothetical protein
MGDEILSTTKIVGDEIELNPIDDDGASIRGQDARRPATTGRCGGATRSALAKKAQPRRYPGRRTYVAQQHHIIYSLRSIG